MAHTDGQLLSYVKALDSMHAASSPPTPEDMKNAPGMPAPDVVIDRFGGWEEALARVNIVRDPDAPPKVPIDVRMTVKARANGNCERCGADPTDSTGGLRVRWCHDRPDDVKNAEAEDAILLCDDCRET